VYTDGNGAVTGVILMVTLTSREVPVMFPWAERERWVTLVARGRLAFERCHRRESLLFVQRGGLSWSHVREGIVDPADASEVFDGTRHTSCLCDFVDR
jgi:hypothetical protein